MQKNNTREFFCNADKLNSELDVLFDLAKAIGLIVPDCNVRVPEEKNRQTAEQYAGDILRRFHAVNEVVWRAEQPLEVPDKRNLGARLLGRKMHRWYEAWKVRAALPLRVRFNSENWPRQPFFDELFTEAQRKAKAGDQIALSYLAEHWGICYAPAIASKVVNR